MQIPPLRPASSRKKSAAASTLEKLQAALTDWMTVTDSRGRRRSTSSATRRSSSRSSSFPADKFRDGDDATDAEIAQHFEAAQERLPDSGEAQGAVRAARSCRRCATERVVSPQDVQRYYEDNEQQYSTPEQVARQPHPAQDRRQGRRGGEEAGGGSARQGQRRRRLRRARDEVFRGRQQQGQGRRPRLLPARARWSRSSTRSRSRWSPARSATSSSRSSATTSSR